MAWELVGNIRGVQGPAGNLDRGQIPLGANLNTFYGAASVGSYGVPLQSIVDGLTNAPAGAKPGTFTVFPVGSTASTQIWTEYLAPGRMFVSGVSTSGRTAPWRDLTASDDGGNFLLSGYSTFDAITKTSNYSLWSGPQATAAGAPVGQVGEIRTYIIGTAGIQTFTTANPTIGTQVFVRGKGTQGWGEFREVTNQPGTATSVPSAKAGFKNAYVALTQPATGGTETVAADAVRWPILNAVGSKRARLHVQNWNWATGTAFGTAAFTGAWMGPAAGKDFTAAPTKVLPAFNLPSNGSEYVSPWFNYDATADVQHLLSVGFTAPAGQANQSSRGGSYRSGNPADAALATGFPGTTSTTSPFDVWLEFEVPASTPIVAGFGDSNVIGSGTTLPVYDSWLNKYARATKSLPYFAGIHGSTTDTWKTPSKTMWNHVPNVARPDAVINFLGQNDLVDGVTLATMQANFNTIMPILRDKLAPEIYAATITPADAKSTAVNAVRKAYNTWLKTLPSGIKDVFDFSAAISDDDTTIRGSDNADGIHFLTSGHVKLAATVMARPVTPPSIQKGDPGAPGAGVPAGGTALQVIRKDGTGTGTEWVTPTKALVGLGSVDNTADLDKPVSAATLAVLQGYATNSSVTTEIQARIDPAVASAIASDPSIVSSAATMAQSTVGLVPVWKASTAYAAGQRVIAPNGDVVAAKVAFTSAATYSATNWNASTQDGRVASLEALRALPLTAVATNTDLDTLRTRGTYQIDSSTTANTLLNMPGVKGPGLLKVDATPSGIIVQDLMIYSTASGGKFTRQTTSIGTSPFPFTPWQREQWGQREVAINQDLNTLTAAGWYTFSYKALADTLVNFPAVATRAAGHVEVLSHSSGANYQRLIITGATGSVWHRWVTNATTGAWGAWEQIGAAAPPATASYPNAGLANAVRQQAFLRRRGGVIGTNGKPAVALRFDHGLANFKSIIMPLLRQYNLPAGLAVNARNWADAENTGTTQDDVRGYVLNEGIEVWNHGATHGAASTTAGYVDEIINGKTELQAQFPMSAIEQWCVPGVGSPGYAGQSSTDRPESFYDYEAGRIIMENHAVSTGHIPSAYRELDGKIKQGMSHQGMESETSALIISRIKTAQSFGAGIQLMLHPSQVNLAGMMTTAAVDEVFAFIAAERDAGRLEVLSMSGLLMADSYSARRNNLLTDGDFTGSITSGVWFQTGWTKSATAGWAKSNASTTPIYQNLVTLEHARGALYEFRVKVKAPAGGDVQLRVCNSADPALLNAIKTFALPASPDEKILRVFATLPVTAASYSNRVQVTDVSGSGIEIGNLRLQAV